MNYVFFIFCLTHIFNVLHPLQQLFRYDSILFS